MIVDRRLGVAKLAAAIGADGDGKLPTEFRIFVAGWNETEDGKYLFDSAAAARTMEAYQAWDVDLAIDLEHQMLAAEIPADPTARDARGWCRLELRDDGSLWAVNVTWTPDGAARLSEKRQRYVSPAFAYDKETQRVKAILNIAITAMPATHSTPALVAASRGMRMPTPKKKTDHFAALSTAITALAAGGDLSPKLVSSALEAVAAKDAKGALAVLQQILAALLGGSAATDEEAPPSSAMGGPPDSSANGGQGAPPPAAAAASARDRDMVAAARVAMVITGMTEPGAAMAELARRSQVAVDVEAREAKLARDTAALESGERRRLVAELVKLGVEIPATAWSDDKGTVPCDRLAKEPIADLRERVKKLGAGRGGAGLTPPVGGAGAGEGGAKMVQIPGGAVVELSAREVTICEQSKCDVINYAVLKQRRESVKTGGQ